MRVLLVHYCSLCTWLLAELRAPKSLCAELLVGRGAIAEGAASYFVHTHLFLWLGLCNSRPWHPRERDAGVAKAHRAGTLMNLIIFIRV